MSKPHIWLRAETKPYERRTPLTPSGAKQLLDDGFKVTVEQSPESIFTPEQYAEVGCDIAQFGHWQTAPDDAIVLGLKELPECDFPLNHEHIYFAHVYKEQQGWQDLLGRFKTGGGKLYDLEYLVDENGRRIAAFGYWAGFAGCALGLKAWALQASKQTLTDVSAYSDKSLLIEDVRSALEQRQTAPKVLVIGALGRSGRGAVDMAHELGLEVICWDIEQTSQGGPFEQLLEVDVVINCVFVQQALPPFITKTLLQQDNRALSMVVDVSCDPYSSFNPMPIYDRCTDFKTPCLSLIEGDKPLDLIAIDHLPSLLPKESSEDYSAQLLQHLRLLDDKSLRIWQDALQLFEQKTALI